MAKNIVKISIIDLDEFRKVMLATRVLYEKLTKHQNWENQPYAFEVKQLEATLEIFEKRNKENKK